MRIIGGIAAILCLMPSVAHAAENGSTTSEYNSPDVEINRSVLQELKGYEPPPMFAPSPAPDDKDNKSDKADKDNNKSGPTLSAPSPTPATTDVVVQPSLTAPDTETLLAHPQQNFHVLTEQKSSSVTLPALPVPAPENKAKVLPKAEKPKKEKLGVHPLEAVDKKPVAMKTAPKENLTIISPSKSDISKAHAEARGLPPTDEKKGEANSAAVKTDITKDVPLPKPVVMKAYKPKTAKTMPAVPAVGVEQTALPPTVDASIPVTRPTIGDKIIDQTLVDKMEKDPSKIKQVLTKTVDALDSKPTTSDAVAVTTPPKQLSFEFAARVTDLSKDQVNQLDKVLMPSLKAHENVRVEIQAYAMASNGDESGARRVSLSRALAMRQYFIDHGIPPARMDLRALGNNTTQSPADRVDIITK